MFDMGETFPFITLFPLPHASWSLNPSSWPTGKSKDGETPGLGVSGGPDDGGDTTYASPTSPLSEPLLPSASSSSASHSGDDSGDGAYDRRDPEDGKLKPGLGMESRGRVGLEDKERGGVRGGRDGGGDGSGDRDSRVIPTSGEDGGSMSNACDSHSGDRGDNKAAKPSSVSPSSSSGGS
jgi:hypothetical protein